MYHPSCKYLATCITDPEIGLNRDERRTDTAHTPLTTPTWHGTNRLRCLVSMWCMYCLTKGTKGHNALLDGERHRPRKRGHVRFLMDLFR